MVLPYSRPGVRDGGPRDMSALSPPWLFWCELLKLICAQLQRHLHLHLWVCSANRDLEEPMPNGETC